MVGLEFMQPGVLRDGILLPFRPIETLTPEQILSLFERIRQSRKGLEFTTQMRVHAIIVRNPAGGARKRRSDIGNLDTWVESHCGHGGSLIKV
jgi:hypothetical protein